MINYNISINDELAIIVEQIMRERKYANRSEFFRDLIRRFYVKEKDYTIEELDPSDPDYQLIESRKKDAEYITMKEVIKELNV